MKPAERRRRPTVRAQRAAVTAEVMEAAREAGFDISKDWPMSSSNDGRMGEEDDSGGRGAHDGDGGEAARSANAGADDDVSEESFRRSGLEGRSGLDGDGDGDGSSGGGGGVVDVLGRIRAAHSADGAVEGESSPAATPTPTSTPTVVAKSAEAQKPPPSQGSGRKKKKKKKKRRLSAAEAEDSSSSPPPAVPQKKRRAPVVRRSLSAGTAATPDLSSSVEDSASSVASSSAPPAASTPPPPPPAVPPRNSSRLTRTVTDEPGGDSTSSVASGAAGNATAARRRLLPSGGRGGGGGGVGSAILDPDDPCLSISTSTTAAAAAASTAPPHVLLCPVRRPRSDPSSDFRVEGESGRDVIGLGRDMKRALANSMETYADETSTRQLLAEAEYSLQRKARSEGGVGSSVVEGSVEEAADAEMATALAASASSSSQTAAAARAAAVTTPTRRPPPRPSLDSTTSVASSAAAPSSSFSTPSKRRILPPAPFSTSEFQALWHTAESRLDVTTEQIESSHFFRGANNCDRGGGNSETKSLAKKSTGGLSAVQTRAQYGRTLFAGMRRIIDMCDLKSSEVFLDIGHGAGNACLQAAFTVGCEARGVEVVPERCRIAELFRRVLLERADEVAEEERGRRRAIGEVHLREGSLTDPAHREFMAGADVVLVNNSHDIFGVRSGDVEGRPTLDAHVGGVLAMLKPGARMVTFHPLLCLGRSLKEENERRRRAKLEESLDASFFTMEKRKIGRVAVSWSKNKEITVYLYRRVSQTGSADTGQALFLCSNKKCWGNSVGTAALDEETGLLVEECVYCGTKRTVKTRR